ncbi:hypothetical protein QQX98_007960 [Neonectria punicea]|uniref:Uncharacterized protein n=1 Tax=Neonectria punicea TaxID=979145 RepID=A0ABR1GWK2_9HYPO
MSPENADEMEKQQIFACRGGQLILPEKLSFFSTPAGWPNRAQELMRDAMGRSSML